jgi:hypothetical protein
MNLSGMARAPWLFSCPQLRACCSGGSTEVFTKAVWSLLKLETNPYTSCKGSIVCHISFIPPPRQDSE